MGLIIQDPGPSSPPTITVAGSSSHRSDMSSTASDSSQKGLCGEIIQLVPIRTAATSRGDASTEGEEVTLVKMRVKTIRFDEAQLQALQDLLHKPGLMEMSKTESLNISHNPPVEEGLPYSRMPSGKLVYSPSSGRPPNPPFGPFGTAAAGSGRRAWPGSPGSGLDSPGGGGSADSPRAGGPPGGGGILSSASKRAALARAAAAAGAAKSMPDLGGPGGAAKAEEGQQMERIGSIAYTGAGPLYATADMVREHSTSWRPGEAARRLSTLRRGSESLPRRQPSVASQLDGDNRQPSLVSQGGRSVSGGSNLSSGSERGPGRNTASTPAKPDQLYIRLATGVKNLPVLRKWDADNDGVITEEELVMAAESELKERRARITYRNLLLLMTVLIVASMAVMIAAFWLGSKITKQYNVVDGRLKSLSGNVLKVNQVVAFSDLLAAHSVQKQEYYKLQHVTFDVPALGATIYFKVDDLERNATTVLLKSSIREALAVTASTATFLRATGERYAVPAGGAGGGRRRLLQQPPGLGGSLGIRGTLSS